MKGVGTREGLHGSRAHGRLVGIHDLISSLAMIGLLISGAWIWPRRRLRRRARRRQTVAPA